MYYKDLLDNIFIALTSHANEIGVPEDSIVFGPESVPTPSLHVMIYPFDNTSERKTAGFLNANLEITVVGSGQFGNREAMEEVINICQKAKDVVKSVGSLSFQQIFPVYNDDVRTDNAQFVLVFNGFVEF